MQCVGIIGAFGRCTFDFEVLEEEIFCGFVLFTMFCLRNSGNHWSCFRFRDDEVAVNVATSVDHEVVDFFLCIFIVSPGGGD